MSASRGQTIMPRYPSNQVLEAEISRLGEFGLDELRLRWLELAGRPAPNVFRRKFLIRAIAYRMQVEAFGGLSPAIKRQLRDIAQAVRAGKEAPIFTRPSIKPGTRLIRLWQGTTHSVTVLPEGFEWNGERYTSLSAIAKAITGTNWNGLAFFGLKGKLKRQAPDAGPPNAA